MADDETNFTKAEFDARLARLRDAMRAHAVDVMLLDDCEILNYFTGYDTSLNLYRACLVPREGRPVMVLRALDAAPFREQAWFDDHVGFADAEDPAERVADTLKANGFASAAIGFDSGSHALSVAYYEGLGMPPPCAFRSDVPSPLGTSADQVTARDRSYCARGGDSRPGDARDRHDLFAGDVSATGGGDCGAALSGAGR